jgi:hypothetical protein
MNLDKVLQKKLQALRRQCPVSKFECGNSGIPGRWFHVCSMEGNNEQLYNISKHKGTPNL